MKSRVRDLWHKYSLAWEGRRRAHASMVEKKLVRPSGLISLELGLWQSGNTVVTQQADWVLNCVALSPEQSLSSEDPCCWATALPRTVTSPYCGMTKLFPSLMSTLPVFLWTGKLWEVPRQASLKLQFSFSLENKFTVCTAHPSCQRSTRWRKRSCEAAPWQLSISIRQQVSVWCELLIRPRRLTATTQQGAVCSLSTSTQLLGCCSQSPRKHQINPSLPTHIPWTLSVSLPPQSCSHWTAAEVTWQQSFSCMAQIISHVFLLGLGRFVQHEHVLFPQGGDLDQRLWYNMVDSLAHSAQLYRIINIGNTLLKF